MRILRASTAFFCFGGALLAVNLPASVHAETREAKNSSRETSTGIPATVSWKALENRKGQGELVDLADQVRFSNGIQWDGTPGDPWEWPSEANFPLVYSPLKAPKGVTLINVGGKTISSPRGVPTAHTRWEIQPSSGDQLGTAIGVDARGTVTRNPILGKSKGNQVLFSQNCAPIYSWSVLFSPKDTTRQASMLFVTCKPDSSDKNAIWITIRSNISAAFSDAQTGTYPSRAIAGELRIEKVPVVPAVANARPVAEWTNSEGKFQFVRGKAEDTAPVLRVRPLEFTAYSYVGLQTGAGQSVSGGLGWVPALEFRFGLSFHAWALTEFPLSKDLGRPTVANTFGGTIGYELWRIRMEGGGGAYALYEFETYAPTAFGKLSFDLRPWLSRFIRGPFLTYQAVFLGPFMIHQAQLGFDFSFY